MNCTVLPCEEAPEQRHCQQPDPVDPSVPPNEISSKPLSNDDVLNSFRQAEDGALIEQLAALGADTAGKSHEDLAQDAYSRFISAVTPLNIGQIDAGASFDRFGEGQSAWVYNSGSPEPVPTDQT